MKVKPYIAGSAEYGDLQGDDYEVPEEALDSEQAFEQFKQRTIEDFIQKFDINFKKKYGRFPNEFGDGTYKDNKRNRSLGRVGMTYNRGTGLINYWKEKLRNRNINFPKPMGLPTRVSVPIEIPETRPWTQQDILYLDQQMERGIPVPQIAEHLMRTSSAVYTKSSRLRR
jgi:hypothetical protein